MPDLWIDDHTGDETVARAEFRAELRSMLANELAGRPARRRPWKAIAWSVAAAASLAVIAITFVATRDDDPSIVPAPTSVASTDDLVTRLTDRRWSVTQLDGLATNNGAYFTLLPNGSLDGFNGCNRYGTGEVGTGTTGTWSLNGTQLTVTPVVLESANPCPPEAGDIIPFTDPVSTVSLDDAGTTLTIANSHVYVAMQLQHEPPPSPTTTVASVAEPVIVDIGSLDFLPALRSELFTTTSGAGNGQLGFETCQECDPARPWGPVVTSDGTILIADLVNSRWLIVKEGTSTAVPMAEDGKVIGQPLLVGDRLFVPEANLGGTTPLDARLRTYDIHDLTTPLEETDVQDLTFGYLHLNGDKVIYTAAGDQIVATVPPESAVAEVTWGLNVTPNFVDVTWKGTTRHWEFVAGWSVGGFGATADGSVYVTAFDGTSDPTDPAPVHLIGLRPDGSVTATAIANTIATNGGTQLSTNRIVQLESSSDGYGVFTYALPT